jgi:hypothetical protein
MKRNPNRTKRRRHIRVWPLAEARAALPYITSVMRSLREHRIEALAEHLQAERLARQPGRPNRSTLLAHAEALRAADQADARFYEALAELEALDIYCLDPIEGLALMPFVHDDELAWYFFELFDTEPLRYWRYHRDPLDERRPVGDVETEEGTRLA